MYKRQFEACTPEQLAEVEREANEHIMSATPTTIYETSLEEARAAGVTGLFGEKYGEVVRVVEAGDLSRELCGGCHVSNTAEIGFLKITSESSVGANVRRIEAVTSYGALAYVNKVEMCIRDRSSVLRRFEEASISPRYKDFIARSAGWGDSAVGGDEEGLQNFGVSTGEGESAFEAEGEQGGREALRVDGLDVYKRQTVPYLCRTLQSISIILQVGNN